MRKILLPILFVGIAVVAIKVITKKKNSKVVRMMNYKGKKIPADPIEFADAV